MFLSFNVLFFCSLFEIKTIFTQGKECHHYYGENKKTDKKKLLGNERKLLGNERFLFPGNLHPSLKIH
jgi:hypothetical protein